MNNKKPINKQKLILNITLYTVLAITLSAVVHFSKKYFETNYNKHSTVESNIDLYKVQSDEQPMDSQLKQPKIIEPNAIEIHPEATAIILDEDIIEEEPIDVIPDTSQEANRTTVSSKQLSTSNTKKVNVADITKHNAKKIEPQKPVTKELPKPKTLVKPEPIAKSVLNNPLFHSFIIQTGAFTNAQDANSYRITIKQIKMLDKYTIDIVKSNDLHKVIIGYFEDSTTAKDVCTQLKKENVQCFATRI